MKIVCFGASVTAQKETAGYYHFLEGSYKKRNLEFNFDKVSFGASNFNDAGFAYMKTIEQNMFKPDVCIIDWLTPALKKIR